MFTIKNLTTLLSFDSDDGDSSQLGPETVPPNGNDETTSVPDKTKVEQGREDTDEVQPKDDDDSTVPISESSTASPFGTTFETPTKTGNDANRGSIGGEAGEDLSFLSVANGMEEAQITVTVIEETIASNRKIVVVTGGVLSGIGKGVTASSMGVLFRAMGLRVTALKIDPYLNVDAGTMSPFEHGEVFVLDDGGETDLDLGNYERFLGVCLTKNSNLSTGKIYQQVIERERIGE